MCFVIFGYVDLYLGKIPTLTISDISFSKRLKLNTSIWLQNYTLVLKSLCVLVFFVFVAGPQHGIPCQVRGFFLDWSGVTFKRGRFCRPLTPPIIMVQLKMDVSPMVVIFRLSHHGLAETSPEQITGWGNVGQETQDFCQKKNEFMIFPPYQSNVEHIYFCFTSCQSVATCWHCSYMCQGLNFLYWEWSSHL